MSIERILLIFRARWRLLLFIGLGAAVVLLPVSLAIAPQYKATASILVEKASRDPIAGVLLPPGVMSNYVATQLDIVRSEHVALRALRAMGLQKDPEWLERWKSATGGRGDFESWLAERLLKRLNVKPSRDSNVFSLSYKSPDPELSSDVVNAFVQAYIDTTLEMRVEPARGYSSFFDERAEHTRVALEEAQARLSAYQKEHGLIATDDGIDVENRRLVELSSQLVELQDGVAAAGARQGQARTRPGHMHEVLSDQVVASLTAELSRQEARLHELQASLGERHPDIIDARAGIAELRNRMEAAIQRASGTAGVSLNVAQARLRELRGAVARQRAKVLEQKAQRDTAAVLSRDVENAQRAYDAVLARASEMELESKNTQTQVSRLKLATPPSSPLWPYWVNPAVAVVLGLLFGAFMVLLREIRDRRLWTTQDALIRLQRPVLLALPDGRTWTVVKSKRSDQTQARLVSSVPDIAAH